MKITPFAMQGRTFTRAAGVSPPWLGNTDGVSQKWIIARQQPYARTTVPSVSPPWVCKPRLQRPCGEFPRFEFACGGSSTGGLRPPLLALLQRSFAGKNDDFCGAQTHIHKSGGRQPAVGVIGRTLSVMCWKRTCKRVCETTGGLRPPLLVRAANATADVRFPDAAAGDAQGAIGLA